MYESSQYTVKLPSLKEIFPLVQPSSSTRFGLSSDVEIASATANSIHSHPISIPIMNVTTSVLTDSFESSKSDLPTLAEEIFAISVLSDKLPVPGTKTLKSYDKSTHHLFG